MRRGFSLVEMLVAMTLTLAIFAITLPFVRAQSRALGSNAGRLDAEQTARYAQRAIDRELRIAVADPGQPLLVYAGPMGIAFTANVLAADTTDPSALGVETGAATTLTEAWRAADAATIPLTARTYPTEDYVNAGGAPSRNETISYFLHADTVSNRSDIYVLYRRVNARDSVQVVRGIHVPADSAFFSYQRMVGGLLTPLASSQLPQFWDSTTIAEVRAVGLRSAGFFRNRLTGVDVIRTVYWMTSLPNAGGAAASCGATPAVPTDAGFSATKQTATRPYRLEFAWRGSADDGGGAETAQAYVIERRLVADSLWSTVASVAATEESLYSWTEYFPAGDGLYEYALRVRGCADDHSARKTWPTVSLP